MSLPMRCFHHALRLPPEASTSFERAISTISSLLPAETQRDRHEKPAPFSLNQMGPRPAKREPARHQFPSAAQRPQAAASIVAEQDRSEERRRPLLLVSSTRSLPSSRLRLSNN